MSYKFLIGILNITCLRDLRESFGFNGKELFGSNAYNIFYHTFNGTVNKQFIVYISFNDS